MLFWTSVSTKLLSIIKNDADVSSIGNISICYIEEIFSIKLLRERRWLLLQEPLLRERQLWACGHACT